jgi:hypothetical protein
MKARIKKIAASATRRTRKPKETIESLKEATDRYYAIREAGFLTQDLWHFLIRIQNLLSTRDRQALPKVDGYVEAAFERWNFQTNSNEADYLANIEVGADLIETAIVGLARLKHEKRNEIKVVGMTDITLTGNFTNIKFT